MRRPPLVPVISLVMMVTPALAQRGMRGGIGPIARPMPVFRGAPVRVPRAATPRVMPLPRMALVPGGPIRVVTPRAGAVIRSDRFGRPLGFFGRRQTLFLNLRNCDPSRFVSCRFLFRSQFHHKFLSPFFGVPFYGAYGYGYPLFWPDYEQTTPQYVEVPVPEPERTVTRVVEQPQPTPAPQPAAQPQPQPELPATVLIFRDHRCVEVRNYAIAGSTLYEILPDGRAKKIPLSDLDLAATEKVNSDRGVEFHVPGHKS